MLFDQNQAQRSTQLVEQVILENMDCYKLGSLKHIHGFSFCFKNTIETSNQLQNQVSENSLRIQQVCKESLSCVESVEKKKSTQHYYIQVLILQDLFNIFYILVPVILSILRFANSVFLSTYLFTFLSGKWVHDF